jgi:hypothetical protein
VIRADPATDVTLDATCVHDKCCTTGDGDPLLAAVPSANAPITTAAEVAPKTSAL